jgi:hypothetical protein
VATVCTALWSQDRRRAQLASLPHKLDAALVVSAKLQGR